MRIVIKLIFFLFLHFLLKWIVGLSKNEVLESIVQSLSLKRFVRISIVSFLGSKSLNLTKIPCNALEKKFSSLMDAPHPKFMEEIRKKASSIIQKRKWNCERLKKDCAIIFRKIGSRTIFLSVGWCFWMSPECRKK